MDWFSHIYQVIYYYQPWWFFSNIYLRKSMYLLCAYLQLNLLTSAHQRPLLQQTEATTMFQTGTYRIHRPWIFKTLHQSQLIPTCSTPWHRPRHLYRPMVHCCVINDTFPRQMCSTTLVKTLKFSKLKRWLRRGSWLVSETDTVLTNRRDILSETRGASTFCTFCKIYECDTSKVCW